MQVEGNRRGFSFMHYCGLSFNVVANQVSHLADLADCVGYRERYTEDVYLVGGASSATSSAG